MRLSLLLFVAVVYKCCAFIFTIMLLLFLTIIIMTIIGIKYFIVIIVIIKLKMQFMIIKTYYHSYSEKKESNTISKFSFPCSTAQRLGSFSSGSDSGWRISDRAKLPNTAMSCITLTYSGRRRLEE
jgi:hypothetical protein